MARDSFNADLVTLEQYMTLVYMKIPGEAAWTLMDQGRIFDPTSSAEDKTYKRIGDINATRRGGTVTHETTIEVYVEETLEEMARMLGFVRPGGGWLGSEEIKLDPERVIDVKAVTFDGITTAADPLFVAYANAFRPRSLQMTVDADGDAMMANIQGSPASYYIIHEAE